jgi:hypothetical protein
MTVYRSSEHAIQAVETINLFGYTGWLGFREVLSNADSTFRDLRAHSTAVTVLPVPVTPLAVALRTTGTFVIGHRQVWGSRATMWRGRSTLTPAASSFTVCLRQPIRLRSVHPFVQLLALGDHRVVVGLRGDQGFGRTRGHRRKRVRCDGLQRVRPVDDLGVGEFRVGVAVPVAHVLDQQPDHCPVIQASRKRESLDIDPLVTAVVDMDQLVSSNVSCSSTDGDAVSVMSLTPRIHRPRADRLSHEASTFGPTRRGIATTSPRHPSRRGFEQKPPINIKVTNPFEFVTFMPAARRTALCGRRGT